MEKQPEDGCIKGYLKVPYNLVGKTDIISLFLVSNWGKLPDGEITCSKMTHINPRLWGQETLSKCTWAAN